MTKEEFENLVDKCVTSTDFEKINHVYAWHPSISETEGKKQIAELYKQYGMAIILQMTEAANYALELEREITFYNHKIQELKDRYSDVKDGDLSFERCVKEVEKYYAKSKTTEDFILALGDYVCPYYSVKQIERAKALVMN